MSTKCEKMTTKKYTERNGPPYKANAPGCRGKRKKGNDGLLYESVRAKNGVYRWSKVVKAAKKVPKKSTKKVPKKTPKKSRKITITQLRTQCRRSGKVYDTTTKKCRKSKRRVKKSKSPKKSSKKMTIKEKRAYCKKNGLVYNPKTKRCNKPKTGVDYKIAKLMKAGYPRKQAIAIALNMKKSGKLGPKGGYKKVKK